jgi:glycosyltransferase involved in cell wall biosynthesis
MREMAVLTAIVPISRMAGRLEPLQKWVAEALEIGIRVVLVHDLQDFETEHELIKIQAEIESPNLVLISKTLHSPGLARNLGMEVASTDWICFWDSDDVPVPREFLDMVLLARDKEMKCAVGQFEKVNIPKEKNSKHRQLEIEGIGYEPGLWRFAFSRKITLSSRFLSSRMGEDQAFISGLVISNEEIFFHEQTVYIYNDHFPGQLTSRKDLIPELIIIINEMIIGLRKDGSINPFTPYFLSKTILTLALNGSISEKFASIGFFFKGLMCGIPNFNLVFFKMIYLGLQEKIGGNLFLRK